MNNLDSIVRLQLPNILTRKRSEYMIKGRIEKKEDTKWKTIASANVSMAKVCDTRCTDGEKMKVVCVFGDEKSYPLKTTMTVTVLGW
jgi:hypothetical protein